MYVKFRRDYDGPGVSDVHGRLDEKVVPSESVTFETTYVRYTKKPCPPDGTQGPSRFVFDDPYESQTEYLEVVIEERGEATWLYVARKNPNDRLAMFIMNEDGKTVDSISCA